MTIVGWARSRGKSGAERGLRRGAWYPVLETSARGFAVLDISDIHVRISRERLQFRGERPAAWAVVSLTAEEAEREAQRHGHPVTTLSRVYLVCPGCHARRHLTELAPELRCETCGSAYPVDWSDKA